MCVIELNVLCIYLIAILVALIYFTESLCNIDQQKVKNEGCL